MQQESISFSKKLKDTCVFLGKLSASITQMMVKKQWDLKDQENPPIRDKQDYETIKAMKNNMDNCVISLAFLKRNIMFLKENKEHKDVTSAPKTFR